MPGSLSIMDRPAIQTMALSKYYGEHPGILDIDLEVEGGEIFGFLGPNGAGKTTLIRTLLDLLHPSAGRARIFGLDSHRESQRIHSLIGNLPGEFSYWEKSTGQEILDLFTRIRKTDHPGWTRELVGRLQADLGQPLRDLSRGNRQKIALILALAHKPKLLLLDEPTSGLDPLMQTEFMQILRELHREGTTVFLSSHDLTEVEQVCHRVGIIRKGRLAAVEQVSQMRARSDHRILLQLENESELLRIKDLAGVHDWRPVSGGARFHLQGDLHPLLHLLESVEIIDLQIGKPSLEELFLAYYNQENS